MKPYDKHPSHSKSMSNDTSLTELLKAEIGNTPITHIVETGTNLGLGSTKIVAEAFAENEPAKFITLEANWRSWKRAKKNLEIYPFVTPLWGSSVSNADAVKFIQNDPVLNNHYDYEDIYIDGIDNPQVFYINEISGEFGYSRFLLLNKFLKLSEKRDRKKFYSGENLLKKYLLEFNDTDPLIILDSAGGIGLLEFQIAEEAMGSKPFRLLLDDIHHLKHFRSFEKIKTSNDYEMIAYDINAGWAFARRK